MDDKHQPDALEEYMRSHSAFMFAELSGDKKGAAAARMRAHEALDVLLDITAAIAAKNKRDNG